MNDDDRAIIVAIGSLVAALAAVVVDSTSPPTSETELLASLADDVLDLLEEYVGSLPE